MIGNKSPAEMRRILREKLALSDAELLTTFNKEIAEAKAKNTDLPDAGEALRLLCNALLREKQKKGSKAPKKRKVLAKR